MLAGLASWRTLLPRTMSSAARTTRFLKRPRPMALGRTRYIIRCTRDRPQRDHSRTRRISPRATAILLPACSRVRSWLILFFSIPQTQTALLTWQTALMLHQSISGAIHAARAQVLTQAP